MVCRHFGQAAPNVSTPIQVVNDNGRYRQLPGRPPQATSFQRFRQCTEIPIVIGLCHAWCPSVIAEDA